MSWQNIAASETDANSPLNQTLMDKIRGNLNALAATFQVLLNQFGRRWTGSAWTELFPPAVRFLANKDEWYCICDEEFLLIPVDAQYLLINVYFATTVAPGTFIRFKIGEVYTEAYSIDQLGPYLYDFGVETFPTGWQNLSVEVMRDTSTSRTVTLTGLMVSSLILY